MRNVIKFTEDDSSISVLTFAKFGFVNLDNYTRSTDWFRILDHGLDCHLAAPLCPGSCRLEDILNTFWISVRLSFFHHLTVIATFKTQIEELADAGIEPQTS